MPAMIEVGGRLRPGMNAHGRPIHPTVAGIENFWRWFGDSRCVDRLGRPLVAYHGTAADFDEFAPSERGDFGYGLYFGGPSTAAEYMNGDGEHQRVMPVYLRMMSPLVEVADYDVAAEEFDLESPAGSLFKCLYGAQASLVAHQVREGDGQIGREIQDKAVERGHDGLILLWNSSDPWFVAYDPLQIKSALGNSGQFNPDSPSLTDPIDAPRPAARRQRACAL